jgi:NADH:ubiquinone oxidoreductase subunit 6 (subunit J)
MEFKTFVFYFLSAILVFAGLRVITARNPVHAALFLVLAFFSASGVWMLLQAEFLAIALVLVYVGAVMVLFLFVVMMLDINLDRLREGFWSYLPLGAIIALLMVAEMGSGSGGNYLGLFESSVPQAAADTATSRLSGADVHRIRLSLRTGLGHPARRDCRRGGPDAAREAQEQVGQPRRSRFSSKPGIACACCRCPPRSATDAPFAASTKTENKSGRRDAPPHAEGIREAPCLHCPIF